MHKSPIFLKEAVIYSSLSICAGAIGFIAQSVFSRYLAAGEFGTLSTVMGIIALLVVPLAAVNQTLTHYLARYHANDRHEEIDQFRMLAFQILKMTAFVAGVLAIVTMLILPMVFPLGRPLLECFALLGVLGYLGTTLSSALCMGLNQFRLWGVLIIAAAGIRLFLAALITPWLPWAETGMALTAFAGLITTVPLFTQRKLGVDAKQALRVVFERGFLVYLAASLSVMLALFCFASGDQVVARHSFSPRLELGSSPFNRRGYDDYQAAGILGRAILCAPVLAVMFTQVSRLPSIHLSGSAIPALLRRRWHSQLPTMKALELLVLYVALLFGGAVMLILSRTWITVLFQGHENPDMAHYLVKFAKAMVPLGMLHAVAVLCLASRSIPECFVIGLAGIAYIAALYFFGRSPELLLTCMFAGACSILLLMAVVQVVRRLCKR